LSGYSTKEGRPHARNGRFTVFFAILEPYGNYGLMYMTKQKSCDERWPEVLHWTAVHEVGRINLAMKVSIKASLRRPNGKLSYVSGGFRRLRLHQPRWRQYPWLYRCMQRVDRRSFPESSQKHCHVYETRSRGDSRYLRSRRTANERCTASLGMREVGRLC